MFLSKDVVLSCFACGRTSGLVVDAGASGTVTVPVSDGWVDIKGFNRSVIGGTYMDAYILSILRKQGNSIKPFYRISKSVGPDYSVTVTDLQHANVHPTYDAWANLEVGRELKEAVCRASDSPVIEGDVKFSNIPLIPYELPDGTHVDIGYEKFQPAELFFDPSPLDLNDSFVNALGLNALDASRSSKNGGVSLSLDTLPRLVVDSILRSEAPDNQASYSNNIVLCGGVSRLDGLSERLRLEVEKIVHVTMPSWKIKTISVGSGERAICSWLGGSILASLGSFHEMWFSRQEYDEYGVDLVDRKCP